MSKLIPITALVSALALTGCASTKTTVVETAPIIDTKPKLNIREPRPVKLGKVEWIVVTPSNAEEVFKKIEASGGKLILYAVTVDGYKTSTLNQTQLLRYIGQQKSVIVALKRYYDEP
jgi:hypothetical protein